MALCVAVLCIFKAMSHVVQAGLGFAMQLRVNLNLSSFCYCFRVLEFQAGDTMSCLWGAKDDTSVHTRQAPATELTLYPVFGNSNTLLVCLFT